MSSPPAGLKDYSTLRLTRHALVRFTERFTAGVTLSAAETLLRGALARSRRLGRNSQTGAIALLTVYENRALVGIVQGESCLTVMTWPQFEPRLPEFGRSKLPRKRGRFLRRIQQPQISSEPAPPDPSPDEWPLRL